MNNKTNLALKTWTKLARAFSTLSKLDTDHIRLFGLTQSQFGVIECLGHLGEMKTGKLCKKLLVSAGNMTVIVDNLAKMELIERIYNKNDRRTIIIKLTQKGKNLFEEIFKEHAKYITELLSVLTQDEQKELGRLLKKLGLGLKEKTKKEKTK